MIPPWNFTAVFRARVVARDFLVLPPGFRHGGCASVVDNVGENEGENAGPAWLRAVPVTFY